MDLTKIIYIGICLAAYVLSLMAENKRSKVAFFLSAVILILFSGLRDISVGIDTQFYYRDLSKIQNGIEVYISGKAYVEIARLLFLVVSNPAIIIFIISLFTIGLFYIGFWKMKDMYSLSWMVLIFICFYYARSMNIARQYLAWAIIFYALSYLIKKKYTFFAIFVLIAVGIHVSAICAFAILGIYMLRDKQNSVKKIMLMLFLALAGPIGLMLVLPKLEKMAETYSGFGSIQLGFLGFFKFAVVLGIVLLNNNRISFSINSKKITRIDSRLDNTAAIVYLIGILFDSLTYFSSYISRVGLYFLSFEFLFWGQVLKNKNNALVYKMLLLLMLIYIYANTIIGDGYGLFPYSTII